MRRVLANHREVAHYWANEVQPYGESGNMFFEDDTIFSYGRHFPIAKHYPGDVILFTNRGYSVSTSKHISYTRQAIPGDKQIVYCYNPERPANEENLTDAIKDIEYNLKKAARARTYKLQYLNNARRAHENITQLKKLFKIKGWKIPKYDFEAPESILTVISDRMKKAEAKKKRQAAKDAKLFAIDLELWKKDTTLSFHNIRGKYTAKFDYCRVNRDKDIVETTQSAHVPLAEAVTALRLLAKGKNLHGLKIGYYTVISYDGKVLKIGCHNIPQSEIDYLRKELAV